jgi:alpha-galactosidase
MLNYLKHKTKEMSKVTWASISDDKKMILGMYRVLTKVNYKREVIKLVGLCPHTKYKITGYDRVFYGDELMAIGLPLQYVFVGTNLNMHAFQQRAETEGGITLGDYSSRVFHLVAE